MFSYCCRWIFSFAKAFSTRDPTFFQSEGMGTVPTTMGTAEKCTANSQQQPLVYEAHHLL